MFAPWTAVRDRTGTLYVAAGMWRDDKGGVLPDPEPLAVGTPTPTTVVSPEGDDVPQGPLVPPDAGARGSDASSPPPETPETINDAGPG